MGDKTTPEWWPPRVGDVIRVAVTTYSVTSPDGRQAYYFDSFDRPHPSLTNFRKFLKGWGNGKSYGSGIPRWDRVTLLVRAGKIV